MKNKNKYIIMYGCVTYSEFYCFAQTKKEAKMFILDCIEENGVDKEDVRCYEVVSKDISFLTKVTLK